MAVKTKPSKKVQRLLKAGWSMYQIQTVPSSKLRKTKRENARAAERLLEKESRPMSSLDNKAKELGVWSKDFHLLSRVERKRIVSTKLSEALA